MKGRGRCITGWNPEKVKIPSDKIICLVLENLRITLATASKNSYQEAVQKSWYIQNFQNGQTGFGCPQQSPCAHFHNFKHTREFQRYFFLKKSDLSVHYFYSILCMPQYFSMCYNIAAAHLILWISPILMTDWWEHYKLGLKFLESLLMTCWESTDGESAKPRISVWEFLSNFSFPLKN